MTHVEHTALIVKWNLVLKSSSCDYSDVNILVSGTVTVNYKRHWRSNANSSIQYRGIGIFRPHNSLSALRFSNLI